MRLHVAKLQKKGVYKIVEKHRMIKLKLPYDVGLLAKLRRVDRVDVWLDAIRVAAGQFF